MFHRCWTSDILLLWFVFITEFLVQNMEIPWKIIIFASTFRSVFIYWVIELRSNWISCVPSVKHLYIECIWIALLDSKAWLFFSLSSFLFISIKFNSFLQNVLFVCRFCGWWFVLKSITNSANVLLIFMEYETTLFV